MVKSVGAFVNDLFYFPRAGSGVFSIWSRNFLYFKYTIVVSIFLVFIEPLVFLFGVGYGLGHFVGEIQGMPYIKFYTPAIMGISGMMVSFFESSYGCYTKLSVQKTYPSILLTPVTAIEVVLGEIIWGASKGFLSVLGVSIIAFLNGLITLDYILPILLILFALCWIFSAFGVLVASFAKNYDWFIYLQTGLIIPMSLFSATYFPLTQVPEAFLPLVYSFPLTHATQAVRQLLSGEVLADVFLNIGVLFVYLVLLTNLALAKMEKRLTN